MLGGVFGKTTGVAPGLRKAHLSWWRFYFYGEGEFVITTDKRSDSFLYGWSELTVSPFDWLLRWAGAAKNQDVSERFQCPARISRRGELQKSRGHRVCL